jgi:transcriptional regulator with XRE-family HTH domain
MNISPTNSDSLGARLRRAREAKSLSIRDLAELSGIGRSTLLDLEQDRVANPNAGTLTRLADELEIESADLFAAAGYTAPSALPSFTPYLRSKYADLPPAAQAELAQSFAHVAEKYGYQADGPAPGEDEI